MRFEPSVYQRMATDWMLQRPACAIWQDPGMRKTASTLAVMRELLDRVEVARWLVVSTPRIAAKVWKAETEKWDPFNGMSSYCLTAGDLPLERVERVVKGKPKKVLALVDPPAIRRRILTLSDQHVFLTIHADLLPRLVKVFMDAWPFDGVVLDESSLFKNYDTSRFKAMRRVRGHVQRMVELTGTPSPRGIEQLWSQIFLLDGGQRLGRTITEFRRNYMQPAPNGFGYVPREGAQAVIQGLVADLCMSMSAEDWQNLPPRLEYTVPVYLPEAAMQRYRILKREYLIGVGGAVIEAETAAALAMKLRQWANGTVYGEEREVFEIHSAKLDALEELCETTDGPVLLAYEFRHDRERIADRFRGRAVFLDEDPLFEENWNAGKIQLGVMHPAQGAHGLSLQDGGSVACWYGPPNDLELFIQFNKRLHRSGQTQPVSIATLVAQGTYDERAYERLFQKAEAQRSLLDAVKQYVRET